MILKGKNGFSRETDVLIKKLGRQTRHTYIYIGAVATAFETVNLFSTFIRTMKKTPVYAYCTQAISPGMNTFRGAGK